MMRVRRNGVCAAPVFARQRERGVCSCAAMRIRLTQTLAAAALLSVAALLSAQDAQKTDASKPKPEDTEVYQPVPPVVTPGATNADPPSDAIVLFDGKNLDEWVSAQDHTPAQWSVANGVMTVVKQPHVGNIETKRRFHNYQLHVEWKVPADITGSGQARGNSTANSSPP